MFWKENVPLSYSRMRELFIQAFKQFVSDIKSYGLHCLRSGGATAACIFLFLIILITPLVSSNSSYPINIYVMSCKSQKDCWPIPIH
jgi:hypothetical protein